MWGCCAARPQEALSIAEYRSKKTSLLCATHRGCGYPARRLLPFFSESEPRVVFNVLHVSEAVLLTYEGAIACVLQIRGEYWEGLISEPKAPAFYLSA